MTTGIIAIVCISVAWIGIWVSEYHIAQVGEWQQRRKRVIVGLVISVSALVIFVVALLTHLLTGK